MSDDQPDPATLYSQALLDLGRLKSVRGEREALVTRIQNLLAPFAEEGSVWTGTGEWFLRPGGEVVERNTCKTLLDAADPAGLLRGTLRHLAERTRVDLETLEAQLEKLRAVVGEIEPGGPWEHSDEGTPAPHSLWLNPHQGIAEVLCRRLFDGRQVLDYRYLGADTYKTTTREEFRATRTPYEPLGFENGLPIPGSWWEFKYGERPVQHLGDLNFRQLGISGLTLQILPRELLERYVYLPGGVDPIKVGAKWEDALDPSLIVRVQHVTPTHVDFESGDDSERLTHSAFRRRYRPAKDADGTE